MIESKNIFIAKLAFGLAHNDFIIVANNQEEAVETLYENYSDFEILYLLSQDYLLSVYEKMKDTQSYLLITIDYEKEKVVIKDNMVSEESLENFKDKEGILLNSEDVFILINDVLDNIKNKSFTPLVSSKFNSQ